MRLALLCLAALALSACGAQRSVALHQAVPAGVEATASMLPPAAAGTIPAAAPEFQRAYAEALKLMREQRYEQASARFAALASSHPEFAGPHMNLGLAYLHLDRNEDAERALVEAAARNPDNIAAQNLLGVVYRAEGRFEEARGAYRRALALDGEYADAHLNLGILLDLYLQQPEEALRHYERYREIRPDDAARVEPWITDLRRNGLRRGQERDS
jgi:tetratricopeptide (TPR) repeat protein